jgi:hypothetical protein
LALRAGLSLRLGLALRAGLSYAGLSFAGLKVCADALLNKRHSRSNNLKQRAFGSQTISNQEPSALKRAVFCL